MTECGQDTGPHLEIVYSRFNGLAEGIKDILYLARLLPDRIQWARVVGGVWSAWSTEAGLTSEVVTCGATYLRHCRGCGVCDTLLRVATNS